jgi:ABC-type glycerol-3-phosphate transport system substrate-binding protein
MRRLFGGMALGAVLLTGCGGDNAGEQASPSTTATTVAPTTTTKPDPAEEGCKQFEEDDPLDAVELLVISKDNRIVEAAKAFEDTSDQLSGEAFGAVEEVLRACRAAGYLP